MRKLIRNVVCLLLAVSFGILMFHGEGLAAKKIKLRASVVGDPVTFYPARSSHTPESSVNQNVFQGLVTYDYDAKPPFPIVPVLAESYEVSSDVKKITFKLHKGVKFHHGYGEFTSEDVVFNMKRHLDPKVASLAMKQLNDLDRVEAPDKYTVVFYLKNPTAFSLLGNLAWQRLGFMTSKKAVEKLGDKVKDLPIGTGPYYFDKWIPAEKIVLKKFDDYWREPAKIDVLEFWIIPEELVALGALDKGDLEVAKINQLGSDRRAAKLKNAYIKPGNASTWQYVMFINHKKKPMDDVRVRRAIAHAIDMDGIAKRIGPLVERFPSPLTSAVFGATDKYWTYDYNVEKAKKLLAEAGYPKGFKLDIIYKKGSLYEPIALEVTNYLKKVVDVNLQLVDKGVFYKTLGEFKHHVCVWAIARFAPQLYAQFYQTGSKINRSQYSNPKVDEVIRKAESALTREDAKKYWYEFQRLVTEDVGNIWPAVGVSLVAIRKGVKGVGVVPFTGIFHFEKTYFE